MVKETGFFMGEKNVRVSALCTHASPMPRTWWGVYFLYPPCVAHCHSTGFHEFGHDASLSTGICSCESTQAWDAGAVGDLSGSVVEPAGLTISWPNYFMALSFLLMSWATLNTPLVVFSHTAHLADTRCCLRTRYARGYSGR